MVEEARERLIRDYVKNLEAKDLDDLVIDMSKYQIFSQDMATVVQAPRGSLGGLVVWNFEPGQENDYHLHPANEHLTIVLEGELEFILGDRPPVTVRPGQFVVIPANVPHGISNKSDSRATYVAVTSPGPYEKILVEPPKR